MQHPIPSDSDRQRERLLQRYLDAFDAGDVDTLADVLAAAETDPELDRLIIAVNVELYAEAGLQPIKEQAQLVRRLLYQLVPSGVPRPDEAPPPLTVQEVARKVDADPTLRQGLTERDRFTLQRLLGTTQRVPLPATGRAMRDLARSLQVEASDAFWEAFRRAAVVLGIGRQQRTLQLAAARRQGRAPRAVRSVRTTHRSAPSGDQPASEDAEQRPAEPRTAEGTDR